MVQLQFSLFYGLNILFLRSLYRVLVLFCFCLFNFFVGNEEESLHEGDIKLSVNQQLALEMFGDPTAAVLGARGLTKYQNLLWSNRVVPYNISQELGKRI